MSVIELLASSPVVFTGTCFVLGLVVGSFLNVVIYRLPLMLEREWREQCIAESAAAEASTAAGGGATGRLQEATPVMPGIPERFNLVVPRSACPSCHAPI